MEQFPADLETPMSSPPMLSPSYKNLETSHCCGFFVGAAEGFAVPHALKAGKQSVPSTHTPR